MQLLNEKLTHDIIGAIFRVYNKLGFGYQEKEYQKALALELTSLGLRFQRELYTNLTYEGVLIRKFYIDFLVEGQVVVELKIANEVYRKHFMQVLQYLKNNNIKIGLIACIAPSKVIIKRVVNERSAKSA